MKRTIYILVCCCALACAPEKKNTDNQEAQGKPEYALALDSAIAYTRRFDDTTRTILGKVPIKAYTVRAADLLEAMGLPPTENVPYTHARIYIGLDQSNNFRLFLTPVEGADLTANPPVLGKDVYMKWASTVGAASVDEFVYDFTSPCPNSCPTGDQSDLVH